jgi:tetratricopeptide (TPR) repeat protein
LDAQDANVQVALGTVLLLSDWDWVGAERAVRRALEYDAGNVDAYVLRGNLLDAHGHVDSAIEMKMRALECAPTSPFVLTQIALSFWRQRDYERTILWTQRALAQDPTHVGARMYLAFALWKIGRYDAVTAELLTQAESFGMVREQLTRSAPASPGAAEAEQWPSPLARSVMQRLPTAAGGPSVVNAAITSGERGERDAAFRHLDRAICRREPCIVQLAVDPQWDSLHNDARFDERLESIGLLRSSE